MIADSTPWQPLRCQLRNSGLDGSSKWMKVRCTGRLLHSSGPQITSLYTPLLLVTPLKMALDCLFFEPPGP